MSDHPATLPVHPHDEPAPQSLLSRLAGMIGLAGCLVGLSIFTIGCHGVEKAFALNILPLLMGAAGMVLTVIAGAFQRGGPENTPILASIFLNLFAMIGGFLERAVAEDWPIFPRAG